jgi:hypothetical protein
MKKIIFILLIVGSVAKADGFSPEFLESLKSITATEKNDGEKAVTQNAAPAPSADTSPFEVPVMEDPKGKVQNGVIYLQRIPFQTNE